MIFGDIWNPMLAKCKHCNKQIHAITVWTHVDTGQEKCDNGDTVAEPKGRITFRKSQGD